MKSPSTNPRLCGLLAATALLGSLASSADAAIVQLNVSSISGPNGGLVSGADAILYVPLTNLSPSAPLGYMAVANVDETDGSRLLGLAGLINMEFANAGAFASPTKFSSTDSISETAFAPGDTLYQLFRISDLSDDYTSPDFGPGSYMGFRVAELDTQNDPTDNFYYGWLEVTWSAAEEEFFILSGAYNSTLNAPITAGDAGISAVPEPSSALGTLGVLAAGMMIRRRGKKAA